LAKTQGFSHAKYCSITVVGTEELNLNQASTCTHCYGVAMIWKSEPGKQLPVCSG